MLKRTGDVHAGRKFINDVPLHRRGEREVEVLEQLRKELDVPVGTVLHVQVGDLFDSFTVDYKTIFDVVEIYETAALMHPQTHYYVYPGNHDLSRDSSKVSAFQLFAKCVEALQNVHVVWNPMFVRHNGWYFGFMPWHPFKTAEELAKDLVDLADGAFQCQAVFTHCDTTDFGGDNVLPTAVLSRITKSIINGHVHKPSEFTRDGVTVRNQGSMQPYAHGEESEQLRYLTLTPEELSDSKDLHDKYIRVKVPKGTTPPEALDCMGWKVIFTGEEKTEAPDVQVEFEEFNTRTLFAQCLKECKVSTEVTEKILEKFDVPQT